MLSFGMEYDRAFSIAFCSARFAAGSPPPSFAATMIARVSFEKSLPRLASAAPFLCLIVDHLLCPDMLLLSHHLQESLVHARVLRQLRVERGDEHAALAQQHRVALVLGQHLHARARLDDARRADEDAAQRLVLAGELEVGLEARDLAAVAVAAHDEVDEAEQRLVRPAVERLAGDEDHPRAG